MIKIFQIIHGGHFGGAEKVVYQIATHLRPPEYDCRVICLSDGRLLSLLQESSIKTYLVPMRSKVAFTVLSPLISILKHEKPDILQSHTGRTNLLARLASRFVRFKKIATVHSPIRLDTNIDLQPKVVNERIEKFTARWTDMFVSVSKEGGELLRKQGIPPEKIRIIYNGVDLKSISWLKDDERLRLRRDFGYSADTPLVGMIAQLRPRKGAEYFLRAIPLILKRLPQTRFLLVGDTEFVEGRDYLHELKEITRKLDIQDKIVFTGFRMDADKIMQILDVLTLPSLFGEGLPLVILESMAYGIPVVASKTSGNIEAVVDGVTGLLALPQNESDLSEKIIRLLESPESRRSMGLAARKRVQDAFSLSHTIEQYCDVYQELVKKT